MQGLEQFLEVTDQIRRGTSVETVVDPADEAYGDTAPVWAQLGVASVHIDGDAAASALLILDKIHPQVPAMPPADV
ncbi:MAG: hypothetical protein CL441_06735 [Acidimicrobiaceae bacterium]|nr:hypothetical protein [Acidimicrobiaceae bacterium]